MTPLSGVNPSARIQGADRITEDTKFAGEILSRAAVRDMLQKSLGLSKVQLQKVGQDLVRAATAAMEYRAHVPVTFSSTYSSSLGPKIALKAQELESFRSSSTDAVS